MYDLLMYIFFVAPFSCSLLSLTRSFNSCFLRTFVQVDILGYVLILVKESTVLMYKENTYGSSINKPRGLCQLGNYTHFRNYVAWGCVQARNIPFVQFLRAYSQAIYQASFYYYFHLAFLLRHWKFSAFPSSSFPGS